MRSRPERGKLAVLAAVVAALVLAMGLAACGDDTRRRRRQRASDVTAPKAGR